MWLSHVIAVAALPLLELVNAQGQAVLSNESNARQRTKANAGTKRVAIVGSSVPALRVSVTSLLNKASRTGAGAAGASTAYHLRQQASKSNIPLDITIFERNAYVGGRTHTVNVYNDSRLPAELGASIFIPLNSILVNASQAFNLTTATVRDGAPKGFKGSALGIWNGDEFVFEQSTTEGWWDWAKLFLRYRLAPFRTQRAVEDTIRSFLGMYDFAWKDLTAEVERIGLLQLVGMTGEQFLMKQKIGDLFAREVIQASTRVNYAQNIGVINGVESMISMAPTGAMSVVGGNWRIFAAMSDYATEDIRLETRVRRIDNHPNGIYTLTVSGAHESVASRNQSDMELERFDEVVIATPYQFSELSINGLACSVPEKIPYVTLHVTLFTSAHFKSARFFDMEANSQVPLTVLTTLPPDTYDRDTHKPTFAGRPGFFSISLVRVVTNPKTQKAEYLYKVFSAKPMQAEFLAGLLDIPVPKGMDEFKEEDISWIHQKKWESYPVGYPRVTFNKLELNKGLWYTGGMDEFISTMETNALMGRNIARLMVERWQLERE